jgi:hypothetical protein
VPLDWVEFTTLHFVNSVNFVRGLEMPESAETVQRAMRLVFLETGKPVQWPLNENEKPQTDTNPD